MIERGNLPQPLRTPGRPVGCRRTAVPGGTPTAGASGSVTAFIAVLAVALLAVAGLVVDGGRALALHSAAAAAAEQAARAGTAAIDPSELHRDLVRIDPAAAIERADSALSASGFRGVVQATPDAVQVTVAAQVPTTLLGIVGLHEMTVRASATATVLHGVSQGG